MMHPSDLTGPEHAAARRRAYSLFSTLWLNGVTPALHPVLSTLPGLGDALPSRFDADDAAATHYGLFGLTVFPYASYFLDAHGQVGGPPSARAQAAYASMGIASVPNHAPDHVGVELDVLARLVDAELQARGTGRTADADRWRVLQAGFLQEHVAPWIQPLLIAVERADLPFYAALATLTRQVVVDHMAAISIDAPAPVDPSVPTSAAPDPAAPETTLGMLADYLVTPARAGFFISQAELRTLGRRLDLPGGFANRRQILINLLRAAATYARMPDIFGALHASAEAWHTRYYQLAAAVPNAAPNVAPNAAPNVSVHAALLSAPWLPRTAQSLRLLEAAANLAQNELEHLARAESTEN